MPAATCAIHRKSTASRPAPHPHPLSALKLVSHEGGLAERGEEVTKEAGGHGPPASFDKSPSPAECYAALSYLSAGGGVGVGVGGERCRHSGGDVPNLTSALIPARRPAGTESSWIVVLYTTSPPRMSATGETVRTVPAACAPRASMKTVAA